MIGSYSNWFGRMGSIGSQSECFHVKPESYKVVCTERLQVRNKVSKSILVAQDFVKIL